MAKLLGTFALGRWPDLSPSERPKGLHTAPPDELLQYFKQIEPSADGITFPPFKALRRLFQVTKDKLVGFEDPVWGEVFQRLDPDGIAHPSTHSAFPEYIVSNGSVYEVHVEDGKPSFYPLVIGMEVPGPMPKSYVKAFFWLIREGRITPKDMAGFVALLSKAREALSPTYDTLYCAVEKGDEDTARYIMAKLFTLYSSITADFLLSKGPIPPEVLSSPRLSMGKLRNELKAHAYFFSAYGALIVMWGAVLHLIDPLEGLLEISRSIEGIDKDESAHRILSITSTHITTETGGEDTVPIPESAFIARVLKELGR